MLVASLILDYGSNCPYVTNPNNFFITYLPKIANVIVPIFFIENLIIQLFIVYLIFLLYYNNNLYYTLLYVFIEIVIFGLFICFYQLELFAGFLWVTEFSIVFIAIILLFYLNIDGLHLKYVNNVNNVKFYIPTITLFLLLFNYDSYSELELFLPLEFSYIDYYDDYYEAKNNYIMNDFTPLTISYYFINSAEFTMIGILLLIGSIACVNLYKSNKNYSIIKQSDILDIFKFFKDFINFNFIKKQNLNKQTNAKHGLRSMYKI